MTYFDKLDKNSKSAIRDGFGEGMYEARKLNKNVVTLTADLKGSVKLEQFEKDFPNDFFEVGIAEQNMMGMAAGMCLNNKIPFVTSFASFNPGRNWDQLRVSVCYSNHNVKILGGHAGLATGEDGATHQILEDIAITRVIPNLTVIVPCDKEQAKKAAIEASKYYGPVYLRSTREKSLNITNSETDFVIGKAQVLDKGDDVTIIACGLALQFALEASKLLKKEKISATVINLHTIKPLDEKKILDYAKKTRAIVTVEEHQILGGMGSAISEFLSSNYSVPIEFVGIKNTFGESGKGYDLFKKYGLSVEEIVSATRRVIKRK